MSRTAPHDHDDYAIDEPVPGLPEVLPQGAQILWQGAPLWWELAKRVFHIRLVAGYFILLMARRALVRLADGGDSHAALTAFLSLLPIAALGLGLLALLAHLSARSSLYTVTNRRIVLRIGIALPTAINLPFSKIAAAAALVGRNGSGDIALTLSDGQRVAYSNFWPHVRPWRINRPEPSLRGIPDVARVAEIVSQALLAALPADASGTVTAPVVEQPGRNGPAGSGALPLPA